MELMNSVFIGYFTNVFWMPSMHGLLVFGIFGVVTSISLKTYPVHPYSYCLLIDQFSSPWGINIVNQCLSPKFHDFINHDILALCPKIYWVVTDPVPKIQMLKVSCNHSGYFVSQLNYNKFLGSLETPKRTFAMYCTWEILQPPAVNCRQRSKTGCHSVVVRCLEWLLENVNM